MAKASERILVVDDSAETREILQRTLAGCGYVVLTASGVDKAVHILSESQIDLVITDLRMPKVSGLDLIRHVHENFVDTAVIMITGYASIDSAVSAVKEGAENYLSKPFTDDELFAAVSAGLSKVQSSKAVHTGTDDVAGEQFGLIGRSPCMQRVFASISKAALANATVLITGESGTGKELVARAIHYNSLVASAPFVPVNCGGIPEGLVESELFGHVKGAFTGAITTRAGFFITADRGTIFLDEIAELIPAAQAKLLRVLEDHHVQMVGASRTREIEVRVIAATNKDLPTLFKKGLFREDLFFRLNVITIELPPLRDREDDVLLMAHHFAAKFAKQNDTPVPTFSDRVLRAFRTYNWPGNIRELENLIRRLVVMTDHSNIDTSDLPAPMRHALPGAGRELRALAEVEAEHIRFVLESVENNKTRAAEILGIDRKTLREKLKNYRMDEAE